MPKPRRTVNGKNKSKLLREFLLKDNSQLGERKKTGYILSSFRNIFYNTLELRGDLTVIELSVILWAFPYVFFSKKALRNRLRMGYNTAPKVVEELIDKGYVEQYSNHFMVEGEREVKSELMGYTYTEVYDKMIQPRYRLTRKGTQLCTTIIDEVDEHLVSSFPYEEREAWETFKYIGLSKDKD